MSILVTGGTGFVGAKVTEILVKDYNELVVCFNRSPVQHRIAHLGEKVKTVSGDIRFIDEIIKVIREYEIEKIIHLSYALLFETEEDPYVHLKLNIQGNNNVFEAAKLMGIKRVINVGSINYYGSQQMHGERPITEDVMPFVSSLYGTSKIMNELVAARYRKKNVDIITAHPGHVIGHGRAASVTSPMWTDLVTGPVYGKKVFIPFKAESRFLIVYVGDVARALAKLCMAPQLRHSMYNVAGVTRSLLEMANTVKKILPEADISFGDQEFPLHEVGIPYLVSSERLKNELGFEFTSLENSIRLYMEEVRKDMGS